MFAAAADFDFPFGLAEAGLLPELTAAYQTAFVTTHQNHKYRGGNKKFKTFSYCDIMYSQFLSYRFWLGWFLSCRWLLWFSLCCWCWRLLTLHTVITQTQR